MSGRLIAEQGELKGLSFEMEGENDWVMGRDPQECHFVVDDPSVSRRHIRMSLIKGTLSCENLSGTNASLLNGVPLTTPQEVMDGDELTVGSQVFTYYSQQPQISHETQDFEEELDEPPEQRGEEEEELQQESQDAFAQIHFDLMESTRFVLKVVAGPNQGAEFPLHEGETYTIGTDPTLCDVLLHDISVSRKHARVTLEHSGALLLEDLASRNGTYVDEAKIDVPTMVVPNQLVVVGTSSFILVDSQGSRETLVAPMRTVSAKPEEDVQEDFEEPNEEQNEEEQEVSSTAMSRMILIGVITAAMSIGGIGLVSLFQTHEVEQPTLHAEQMLQEIFTSYPSIRYAFTESSGHLLVFGHVLSRVDRNQLIYTLRQLPFVKTMDDNIVIDESVWREINQVLAKNPAWRSVAMVSRVPGQFVLTGYLETRKQNESLSEYINQNFLYLDLLENRIIVEEDINAQAVIVLRNQGLSRVFPEFIDGDMKVMGTIPFGTEGKLANALKELRDLPGVRTLQNLVVEQRPQDSITDISETYKITGVTGSGSNNISVVINGRILSVGDVIDGFVIVSIKPNVVLLEKGGSRYKIEFN